MKKLSVLLLVVFAATVFAGCGGAKQDASKASSIKVGVTAGPHAEIMDVVKKIAEKDGLKIQVVEFNDYIQPNVALNQGDIDVNSFQHEPYLDNIVKDRKFELVSIAKTVIFPMGLYSKKVKNLTEIKPGSVVAIPNDPTNGGRALALLERHGMLKLKPGLGHKATAADILENPKNLKIKELDAAQLPRSIADVDLAAVNTNYAIAAGMVPVKDAIALEDGNSPYANLIVARIKDKDNPAFQKLIKAYQTEEVRKFILDHFKGSVIAAW
ncbi:MetQ/NlpA family ABC transporter substrate-binding protein [Anaerosporomusa subterranea]|uniref:MetQ/NlpA family ABC transporter substrate-binding protein n=1 Tax=Anaerosporomusa subterranea TaxID=1794912 RepID=UPI0009ECE81E|nr:MetQ/NlpA family ABC transporter substrate-binding protein [Anaerosporomusa subterranea]